MKIHTIFLFLFVFKSSLISQNYILEEQYNNKEKIKYMIDKNRFESIKIDLESHVNAWSRGREFSIKIYNHKKTITILYNDYEKNLKKKKTLSNEENNDFDLFIHHLLDWNKENYPLSSKVANIELYKKKNKMHCYFFVQERIFREFENELNIYFGNKNIIK